MFKNIIITFLLINFAISAPYSSFLMEGKTSRILHAKNAHEKRHPASLTKSMLAYVVFKKIKMGKVGIQKNVTFSKLASIQMPSKLGLKPGEKISLYTALQALFVKSANDVAVAVAESVFGSVHNCVYEMNKEARMLGMKNTIYFNPSGVPDRRQVTTAYDQAILAKSLYMHFPEFVNYFKLKHFTCKGKVYKTHNHLLFHPGVDGIKTGYINASGYNVMTSVVRKEKGRTIRLFGVVMGGVTPKKRDSAMINIIKDGYRKLQKIKLT